MGDFSTCIRVVMTCGVLLGGSLMTSCASKLTAEAEWNHLQIWRKVGDTPATYVPKGYGAARPRTEKEGTWVVDARDGKRLFVPKEGVPGYPAGELMGEAKNVTGYKYKNPMTPAEHAVAFPVWLMFSLAGRIPYPDG